MSVGIGDKRQGYSVDAALIALAQARDQIGVPDDRLRGGRSAGPELKGDTGSESSGTPETSQSVFGTNLVTPPIAAARGGLLMWGLIGLGALVPIGVVILGWHFLYRQVDVAPVSTSLASTDFSAKSATPSSTPPRAAPQRDTAVASVGSPRLDLDRSVAAMTHQVADLEQEIGELKSRQCQILLDNSELDRQLKQAQELARSSAELIKDLKSAQAQTAQDNADLAAQIKASQEQVTKLAAQLDAGQTQVAKIAAQIKASQDHNARLVEQKQGPQQARVSSPPRQLAPRPRLQPAKPQTENPAETQ